MATKAPKDILGEKTPRDFLLSKLESGIYQKKEDSVSGWVKEHQFLTERGTPVEFEDHYFLKDIYDDWSQTQVILKAAQVGFSTMAILKSLFAAAKFNYNIIYTLPTFDDVRRFVPSKVNQMISRNKELSEMVYGKDTIDQKRVGGNFIYYQGTWTEKTALMLSSDMNMYDEYDRSDQKVVAQYESRLQFSNYKGQCFFSNPSAPASGVGKIWTESDQKHFFFRCSKCGHRQYIDWEDSLDKEKQCYVCKRCHKRLTRADRFQGEWVKKWRDKEISGYWISQMMSPWLTAKDLMRQEETKSKQYFYNFCLGLPYIGTDVVVDRGLILANVIPPQTPKPKEPVIMGVDNGIIKHFVVGTKDYIFQIGATKDWKEIEDIRNKYNAVMVVDALPDFTVPKQLRAKYPYKVWLNYYQKDKNTPNSAVWGEGDRFGQVTSDRSKVIQETIDEMVLGHTKFAVPVDALEGYIKHWEAMYQITETDALGIERQRWESQGADHWSHAQVYYQLGLQRIPRAVSSVSYEEEQRKPVHPELDLKKWLKDRNKTWLSM